MTVPASRSIRALMLTIFAALLAACQSLPAPAALSAEQIAVLKEEGFVETTLGWELNMPERLLFETNESSISAEQQQRIREIASRLTSVGITTARVEGHTDSTGTSAYNLTLSQARADAVAAPMRAGGMTFAADQIVGRGETLPLSSNDSPEGRQDNRRVVVIVTPMPSLK